MEESINQNETPELSKKSNEINDMHLYILLNYSQ